MSIYSAMADACASGDTVLLPTFVVFRADNLTQAFTVIGRMFSFGSGVSAVNADIFAQLTPMFITALALALVFSTPVMPAIEKKLASTKAARAADIVFAIGTLGVFALSILFLVSNSYNPFIYFRF